MLLRAHPAQTCPGKGHLTVPMVGLAPGPDHALTWLWGPAAPQSCPRGASSWQMLIQLYIWKTLDTANSRQSLCWGTSGTSLQKKKAISDFRGNLNIWERVQMSSLNLESDARYLEAILSSLFPYPDPLASVHSPPILPFPFQKK